MSRKSQLTTLININWLSLIALTLISLTAPPPALTSAELAIISVSTPTTFEGIAPLLRHKEELVELTIDPPFESFAGGKGSLFITEGLVNFIFLLVVYFYYFILLFLYVLTESNYCRAVSFYSPSTSTGISIPYPLITLHAISRAPLRPFSAPVDSTSVEGGGPCIYCQIDETEGAEDDADGEGTTREVIIVPSDATACMFILIFFCSSKF